MSYTSSDPENLNRDPDTSSLASTSTTASQLSKSSKKKPWSKLKSGLKSIGRKMSTGSKPNFAEPTESSEHKRVGKKNKKSKDTSASESKASSSEGTREKSPSKGPKNLIKKLSVESLSTPFVGYQPSSVSPTRSYAKAVYKSASTSESNLSASDMDTPRKSSTLESPDSGRVSRSMEGSSRPPSQITEEGYVSTSDTDSISAKPGSSLGLVAKTQHFAQSVIPPKVDKDVDVSTEFIKAETVVKSPAPTTATSNEKNTVKQTEQVSPSGPASIKENKPADINTDFPAIDEVEGRKKNKRNNGSKKASNDVTAFINVEKSDKNVSGPSDNKTASQDKENPPKSSDKKSQDKKESKKSSTEESVSQVAVKQEPSDKNDSKKQSSDNVTSESKKTKPVKSSKSEEKSTVAESIDKSSEKRKSKSEEAESKSAIPTEKDDVKENNKKVDTGVKKEVKDKKSDSDSKVEPKKTGEKVSTKENVSEDPLKSAATSDFGPSTPSVDESQKNSQMSVEEKLEAFLSAEGWSGTIKDIAEKTSEQDGQQADKRECLYKILVIGELGTGKTSIIKRYVHQFFSQHYRATIGVDFALKVINWDPNTIIRLQLWDIAGQERFGNMTRVYYKEAVGAFIVFDVTRSATFDAVLKWKQDLDSKVQLADGSPIPCVLLANKCDQQKEGLVNTPSKMDEYCKENNFSAWFETSAKENINIDDAAKSLVTQILQNDRMSQNGRDSTKDGSKFPLENKSEEEGRTCAC